MSLKIGDEVRDALARVRDDKCGDDFALAGYGDDGGLQLIGSGEGGITALKELLLENDICYGLVRKTFTWDKVGQLQADTTKFVFILWRPDTIPLKRKMTIGKFEGQVKKLFSSYHTDLDISSADELSEEILSDLIAKITMTADKTTNRKSRSMFFGGNRLSWKKSSSESKAAKMKPDSRASFGRVAKGANVKFSDEDVLREAIADVRNDSTSTRWCLASYSSKDAIAFTAKGDGDVSELLEHCKDTKVSYGFFRVSERIDKAQNIDATKFCFVVWTPNNIPPMMKATISTHKGTVTPVFRPFHQDFNISEKDELSPEIAMEKISGVSGSRSHVTDRKAVQKEDTYERKFLGGVKNETQKLEFENKEDLLVAIADVRSDSSDTNWVVASLEGGKKDMKLRLVGSGSNGIQELVDQFEDEKVMFGLLRNEEIYDRSTTIKFYYIQWQGSKVSVSTKGSTGVLTGAVNAIFSPYHDDIYGSSVEEVLSNAKSKAKDLK